MPVNRWLQLVAGIICMVMIANLQYGWTYFVDPINARFHWGRTDIQVAFTIFVATETWLVPVEGWFVDRFGPRIVVMLGGIVVALAWTMNAYATTLPMLYVAAAVSGVGAGAVYGTCVGNALKWFGDRRGLAAGSDRGGLRRRRGGDRRADHSPSSRPTATIARFCGSGWSGRRHPGAVAVPQGAEARARRRRRRARSARRRATSGRWRCCARRCSGFST